MIYCFIIRYVYNVHRYIIITKKVNYEAHNPYKFKHSLFYFRMKEMQDANLFGDETCPNTPSPHITEISLKDIVQAVDLNEFRKQNHEDRGNCRDKLLPVKENNSEQSTVASNAAFDLTPPDPVTDLSTEVLNMFADYYPENGTIKETNTDEEEFVQFKTNSNNLCPIREQEGETAVEVLSETETNSCSEQVYDVPSEVLPACISKNKTPNGDMFSNDHKQTNKELSFSPSVFSRTDENESGVSNADLYPSTNRRFSSPDNNTKDSRTFHPRKRQTVHGNRRDRTHRHIEVEKFSKEELMLMWKSSELELNEKLKEAVKDKQRLETKLTALKLHMSTPV